MRPVWNEFDGQNVTIGIVDDGVESDHPDLRSNVSNSLEYDFTDRDTNADPSVGSPNVPNDLTEDSHGTAVAELAGATGDNNRGVAGVAYKAELVGIRLTAAASSDSDDADAVAWKNSSIDIKNNSWGPDDVDSNIKGPGPETASALRTGTTSGRGSRGVVYVWSGGNGGAFQNSNLDGFANSIYAIGVGAHTQSGSASTFTEWGANIALAAPGGSDSGDIVTTDLEGDDGYNGLGIADDLTDRDYSRRFNGTSAAASIVSGVAALMLQARPALAYRDVKEILMRTARKSSGVFVSNSANFSFDYRLGAGQVDAEQAVATAKVWIPLGSLTSTFDTLSTAFLLPDDGTPVVREFNFPNDGIRIEHITVEVQIDTTFRGDLRIALTSPNGTVSELINNNGGNADNLYWTFTTVRHWGESTSGDWQLTLADDKPSADTATVRYVKLTAYGFRSGGEHR